MNKKSQGLSINAIIIAVIALIVLVVLVAIFTNRLGIFSRGVEGTGDATKTCLIQRGEIKDTCDATTEVSIASSDAAREGGLCCRRTP